MLGYQHVQVADDQWVFIATPEKALLDLAYLQSGGDDERYLRSLRLQALEQVNMEQLYVLAEKLGKPKLMRAAEVLARLCREEGQEYKVL
jgi:hypothetical protein